MCRWEKCGMRLVVDGNNSMSLYSAIIALAINNNIILFQVKSIFFKYSNIINKNTIKDKIMKNNCKIDVIELASALGYMQP